MNDELRKFPPLKADHPLVNEQRCAACKQFFVAGDITTIIFVGPGDDPEARERAREGRAYTGVGVPAHWACATGEEA
jgi:hypothetical protein